MARKAQQRTRAQRNKSQDVVASTGSNATVAVSQGTNLVGTFYKAGRLQDAILAGESVIAEHPNYLESRIYLAKAYWTLAMVNSTLVVLNDLLENHHDSLSNLEIISLRAEIACIQGDLTAPEWFKRLSTLSPDHGLLRNKNAMLLEPKGGTPDAQLERAIWHKKRGDKTSALRQLEQIQHSPVIESRVSVFNWAWKHEEEVVPRGSSSDLDELPLEEDVGSQENQFQVRTSASDSDDLVIEADADEDDADGEHFRLPGGVGAISIRLPFSANRGFNEDEEVVVIEREDRTQLFKESQGLWIRAQSSVITWRPEPMKRNTTPHSDVGKYGFDDADDVATEVAHFTADGQLISRRAQRLKNAQVDEDQEIIVAKASPATPSHTPAAPAKAKEDWEGPTRVQNKNAPERRAVPLTSAPSAPDKQDEDLMLDLEEPSGAHRVTEPEGPVAKLAPSPAGPLKPSAPPPMTSPPVPPMPSQFEKSGSAKAEDTGPGRPTIVLGQGTRDKDRTPLVRTDYFQRSSRATSSSKSVYWISAVAGFIVLAVGYIIIEGKRSAEFEHLRSAAVEALRKDDHGSMSAARQTLLNSPRKTESELRDLLLLLEWSLWAEEGIREGGSGPDEASLEAEVTDPTLFRSLARSRFDLIRGDLEKGELRLQAAKEAFGASPSLELSLADFALSRGAYQPEMLEQAKTRYQSALSEAEQAQADSDVTSKTRALLGLARVAEVQNDPKVSQAFQAALAADPEYVWASLYVGLAAVPDSLEFLKAEEAIIRLAEAYNDRLSPRQRSTLMIHRAERALRHGDYESGIDRLGQAARMDPSNEEAMRRLGQLYLDLGQISKAEEHVKALVDIAPLEPRAVALQVSYLLEIGQVSNAKDSLKRMREEYQESPHLRMIKARILMAQNEASSAESQLEAALIQSPDSFEIRLEKAILRASRGDQGVTNELTALRSLLRDQYRPTLDPVLAAYLGVLESSSIGSDVQKASWNSARALVILADSALARNDRNLAEKMLRRALEVGDMPKIRTQLASFGKK